MRRTEDVMGMPVTIDVRDGDTDLAPVYQELRRIDELFSTFKPDSEICRINDGRLALAAAGPEVHEVLALCDTYEARTGGFFSARRDGALDPSGLVKGWAIARAAAMLDARDHRSYFVDAGGDVQTRGSSGGSEPWRVGIRHPIERGSFVRVVLDRGMGEC